LRTPLQKSIQKTIEWFLSNRKLIQMKSERYYGS